MLNLNKIFKFYLDKIEYMAEITIDIGLEMVQGCDSNGLKFTAFVICTSKQRELLKLQRTAGSNINLSEMKIIYTIPGHKVSDQLISDAKEYYDAFVTHRLRQYITNL